MYFESFNAGILTLRVSQARKQPNAYILIYSVFSIQGKGRFRSSGTEMFSRKKLDTINNPL